MDHRVAVGKMRDKQLEKILKNGKKMGNGSSLTLKMRMKNLTVVWNSCCVE